ncbi:MAG: N-acetyltransferase [Deltaproteobacteria bacterium]|nr:N-acetyltransferase [Deltaproteobacteria bacterium]
MRTNGANQVPDRMTAMNGVVQLSPHACIADDVRLGAGARVGPFVNLYGCEVGDDSRIGAFVEIQRGARIGARCKISSHSFICQGVTIEDEVFVGHGVVFINDRTPRATNPDGQPQSESDWRLEETVVRRRASLGSGAIIMCGVEIGEGAMVGAGALVTHDVPAHALVAGVPARLRRLTPLGISPAIAPPNQPSRSKADTPGPEESKADE